MAVLFKNAQLVTPAGIVKSTGVLVQNGKIAWVGQGAPPAYGEARVIDAGGDYLSAGLIDLHVHGANGHVFTDATEEAIRSIADYHGSHGVTTLLPTSSACPEETLIAALEAFLSYAHKITSCNLPGVHLEGPYFNQEQKGAQDERYIVKPVKEQYEKFLDYGCVLRMSAAPEIEGGLALGDALKARGILASVAHTDAYYDDIVRATEHGYTLMTHLYSGMEGVRRKNAFRRGGAVEAGLLLDGLHTEIIADGCHLPACLLKLIYKCKGVDKIILTSDATRGAGFADGQTVYSEKEDREIIIEDGVAKTPDRQAFAGSIASGDRLIRTMVNLAGVPLHEAVTMMTINPARLIGLDDRKGLVKAGMDADLIMFDKDINIKMVLVNGVVQVL